MRLLGIALTTLITAAVLMATPASASTTFTPDGGPEVNFVGTDITFTNIQADQELNCEQVDFAGTVVDPGETRVFGENAGALSSLTASGCTNDIGGLTDVDLVGSPTVSITAAPNGTAWPAQLNDVSAIISAPGCNFTVDGSVDGVFDTATQVVTPTANTLTITEITGYLCQMLGLAKDQTFTVDGSWTNVTPAGSSPLFLTTGTSDTFTPYGGSATDFIGADVDFTVIQADQSVTCAKFDLAGDLFNPGTSRPFGDSMGELGDLTAHGCTNPIAGSVLIQQNGPWELTVTGSPSGALWPVRLVNISAFIHSAGCEFNIHGSLHGTFDTSTQALLPDAAEMEITDVPAGFLCAFLGVAEGQDIHVEGSWTNVPPTGSGPLTFAVP